MFHSVLIWKINAVNDFFLGVCDLKSLLDAFDIKSLNVISGFEAGIRSIRAEIPAALSGAHRFVSTKFFDSLQLKLWS